MNDASEDSIKSLMLDALTSIPNEVEANVVCKDCMLKSLSEIVSQNAGAQAAKGIVTAGVKKATIYAIEKVKKKLFAKHPEGMKDK